MKRLMSLIVVAVFTLSLIAPVLAEDEGAKKILKGGLLGAGVGAVAAGASGGKAGKGALIGAGANIAGGAIMDALSGPSQSQQATSSSSSQEVYNSGYQQGFDAGYSKGYAAGLAASKKR